MPAARNSTPSSRRGAIALEWPAMTWTTSPSPIAIIASESTNVLARCTCPPFISNFSLDLAGDRSTDRPTPGGSLKPASARPALLAVPVSGDQRDDQDRDDVGHLDHRVDRGAGRVLEGITDRVAGDRRGMRFGALAAERAVLDQLL